MIHDMLQQAADNAMAMGPTVLVEGMQLQSPIDVVRAPALSLDDKRTILAAWASDFLRCRFQAGAPSFAGNTRANLDR
jgi:hypothetical protein